jgi:hypothetical protein
MGVGKPQAKFMMILLTTLLIVRGKANYSNLGRYASVNEKTLRRWYARPFDFERFNQLLLGEAVPKDHTLALVIDASFLAKSGRHTYGLDWFWNGCQGRTERGLEISVVGLADLTERSAWALSVKQTPARECSKKPKQGGKRKQADERTRIDDYLDHLTTVSSHLPAGVECVLCDALYAKRKFIDGALELGLDIVSKLRLDADMCFLYAGPQKARGRKRLYGDKVSLADLSGFEQTGTLDGGVEVFTTLVRHQSLKRTIRVVLLRSTTGSGLVRQALLFATDTALTATEIVARYTARFQVEFLIRDAKQGTGLVDCQARNAQAIHMHVNASLTAVNVAKLHARQKVGDGESFVFSLASVKRRAFNTHLLEMIIQRLELEPTSIKSHPNYPSLRDYGALAA